jgi:uncharacterized membrane protein
MTTDTTADSRNAGGDGRTAGIVLAAGTVAMGLIAGLYFGWGVAVMPGLGELDDRAFVDAAQQLDDAIRSPLFFATFTAALVLPGVALFLQRSLGLRQATPWIVAALVLYGIGALTTMAINEPLNQDLVDAGDPSQIADPAGVRDDFEDPWVAWHIVRTVLSTAALGALAYALILHGRDERELAQREAGAGEPAARPRGATTDVQALAKESG